MASIRSINIGGPGWVDFGQGQRMRTSLHRKPAPGKILLDTLGLEGDRVADPVHHGGPDKAVCVYPADHFPFWEKRLKRPVEAGAFGENLTTEALTERQVHIGDVFRIGGAEVQVTQPRQPCHKLNKIFDQPQLAAWIQESGFSGYYLRVLKAGWLATGDAMELVECDPAAISIDQANTLLFKEPGNVEGYRRLLAVPALSESWRRMLATRVE